jgi:hypothetical protein
MKASLVSQIMKYCFDLILPLACVLQSRWPSVTTAERRCDESDRCASRSTECAVNEMVKNVRNLSKERKKEIEKERERERKKERERWMCWKLNYEI